MPGRRVSETKPYTLSGLVAEWLRSGLQNRVRVFNSLPDLQHALLAQQDRASDYESEGRRFDSFTVRHASVVQSVETLA